MVVDPGVQFKPVERDSLPTDRDFSEMGTDLRVEAVAVHAEVARGIPEAEEPRENGLGAIARQFHVRMHVSGRDTRP